MPNWKPALTADKIREVDDRAYWRISDKTGQFAAITFHLNRVIAVAKDRPELARKCQAKGFFLQKQDMPETALPRRM